MTTTSFVKVGSFFIGGMLSFDVADVFDALLLSLESKLPNDLYFGDCPSMSTFT